MAHELRFRPTALADLDDIFRAVLRLSASAVVAERYVRRIRERCRRITLAPLGGRPRDDQGPGLRTVPFERRTVIVYRILPPATVEIINFFYGGRNYVALYRGMGDHDPEASSA